MKLALEGSTFRGALPDEWRLWKIVEATGWSLDQIDDAPGHLLDWFLRLDALEQEVRSDAERRAARG